MKKNLFFVAAALAAMFGATSCVNEVDMFKYNGTGTINLSVTNDDVFATTRADATSLDNFTSDWIVTITGRKSESPFSYTKAAGTALTATHSVPSDTYDITAKSGDAEANATSTSSRGKAFWTKSIEQAITAGQTANVVVDCGKATNGRVEVEFSDDFKAAFSTYKLTASVGSTTVDFDATNSTPAYFAAGTAVNYVLTYGEGKRYSAEGSTKSITIVAGTSHKLSFTTNNEGQITLMISYTDFEQTSAESVQFNALTGEIVTP